MKAFILKERNNAIFCDIKEPILNDEYGAILKPLAISVCTSDINTIYGSGSKKPDNLVLGHECVAQIIEVGNKVKDFKQGDIVAVPSMTPNWRSKDIQDGNFLHAESNFSANALGRSIPGVFAEKFYLDDIDLNVAHIGNVDILDALMCVDMACTAFNGIKKANINFGDTICIIGIGGVGLMSVRASYLSGAAKIIAVGSKNNAMHIAKDFGADIVINYKFEDYVTKIKELTNNKGVDVVVICGGNDDVINNALALAKYGTGRIVNLKHYSGDSPINIDKFNLGRGMCGKDFYFELGMGGRVMLERMLSLVENKKMQPNKIITHKFNGFENLPRCIEMMRDKGADVIKTAIKI